MYELFAAFGAGLLVAVSALVQHLNAIRLRGVGFALSDRSAPSPSDGFAGRATRTLRNNLESAAMMTPLALGVVVAGTASSLTAAAGAVYLAARIGFTLAYWFGLYFLRSFCWGVGMGAIGVMAYAALAGLSA